MTPEQQKKVDAISQTPIALEPVKSSQLVAIGHDPATNTLAVRFQPRAGEERGGLYHYANVNENLFAALKGAASAGSFFHANIRPNATDFPYVRITDAVKEGADTSPSSTEQQAA